jgi:hypothetical protein
MGQILPLDFGGADPIAHTSNTLLPLLGQADITDVPSMSFPFPVTIVGLSLAANPASGDTVTVTPSVGGVAATPSAVAGHVATAPSEASWWGGPLDGVLVPANTEIGLFYKTTTGTTYTANDILGRLWLRLPEEL